MGAGGASVDVFPKIASACKPRAKINLMRAIASEVSRHAHAYVGKVRGLRLTGYGVG